MCCVRVENVHSKPFNFSSFFLGTMLRTRLNRMESISYSKVPGHSHIDHLLWSLIYNDCFWLSHSGQSKQVKHMILENSYITCFASWINMTICIKLNNVYFLNCKGHMLSIYCAGCAECWIMKMCLTVWTVYSKTVVCY